MIDPDRLREILLEVVKDEYTGKGLYVDLSSIKIEFDDCYEVEDSDEVEDFAELNKALYVEVDGAFGRYAKEDPDDQSGYSLCFNYGFHFNYPIEASDDFIAGIFYNVMQNK